MVLLGTKLSAVSYQLSALPPRRVSFRPSYPVEGSFAPSRAHSPGATKTQGLRPGLNSSAPNGAKPPYRDCSAAFTTRCLLLSAYCLLHLAGRRSEERDLRYAGCSNFPSRKARM